jgi:hypothetical protein
MLPIILFIIISTFLSIVFILYIISELFATKEIQIQISENKNEIKKR